MGVEEASRRYEQEKQERGGRMEIAKILEMIYVKREDTSSGPALIAPAGVELGLAMLARVNTSRDYPDMWMALNVL